MRVALFVVLTLLAGLRLSPTFAHGYCETPLGDWQPREALQTKLEAQGWRDVSIRIEDGCYLVHAFNDQGDRLHGKFDPATLEPLPGGRGHHGHDGHDGWGHDRGEN